jgi:magnesium chelatase subunit D
VAAVTVAADQDARRWHDACLAAALFALDPAGTGVVLRAGAGPARDAWLLLTESLLPGGAPRRRIPLHVTDSRLLGGLDLAATLRAGRPIAERGILASVDGGVVLLAMAERLSAAAAARITCVLDTRELVVEREGFASRRATRFGVIALDEGAEADERPPAALLERLALHLDIEALPLAALAAPSPELKAQVRAARARGRHIAADAASIELLCQIALALGIGSARAPSLALSVARAAAALEGRDQLSEADLTCAARLVLAPRATRIPQPQQPPEAEAPPERNETQDAAQPAPPGESSAAASAADTLEDRVLEAAATALPAGLLAGLKAGAASVAASAGAGRRGVAQRSRLRGRPLGAQPGDPAGGARLNVIETLRAAAPWQRLRGGRSAASGARVRVLREDFRVTRFKERTPTTTIFVVDASGSSALHRLGEAKGAVELLLADCYVRRDRVALIAFRGRGAQLLLPPTRSLVRAKRSLAGLPGGGGTPLASGVDAARELADALRRRGETPVVVFLTDGQANVARNGQGGRAAAEADALQAARLLRALRTTVVLLDTAPQPLPRAARIALEMGARYLPLPHADARTLAAAVRGLAGAREAAAREVS